MSLWHRRSKRKPSGGRLRDNSKKLRRELGRDAIHVKIEKRKAKKLRIRGGGSKLVLVSEMFANVAVGKASKKAKILSVIKNPANPNLVRQNIITKGCTIQTDMGKALVTSRPGQSGLVNAILLEEK